MTIYDQQRAGRPVNPALALYKFWYSVLTGTATDKRDDPTIQHRRSNTYWGPDGWRLQFLGEGPLETPTIAFGGTFNLNHKGEFMMLQPHGYKQRMILSRGTFLDWSLWRSSYHWYVDTNDGNSTLWHDHYGAQIKDWQNPRHYVSEQVMGARRYYWSDGRPWMKLVWSDEFGWHIAFSRNRPSKESRYHDSAPITKADFERFERLRQQRYYRMEKAEKVATGEWTIQNRRVLTREEREARQDEAVQVIMANLVVSQNARTTPLRRENKEEGLWPLPSGRP